MNVALPEDFFDLIYVLTTAQESPQLPGGYLSHSWMMIQEDASAKHNKARSPSGDRRNKKEMKIQGSQRGSTSCNSSPGPKLSDDDSSSETEGGFSPANSVVDPNFLSK